MGVIEIIAGSLLLIACVFIILVVMFQEAKDQGMTSAIGGGSNESFFEKIQDVQKKRQ